MKFTAKHAFITIIIAAIAIPLLFFAWNEFQKEPIDITMYGAQVTQDGTVLTKTEFALSGYRIPVMDSDRPLLYKARFNTIAFSNTDVKLKSISDTTYLYPVGYEDDLHNYGTWLMYSPEKNRHVLVAIFLHRDLTSCAVAIDGNYFIGSVDPDADLQEILDFFLDLGLKDF